MQLRNRLSKILNRQRIAAQMKQNQLGFVLLPLLSSAICVLVEKFAILLKTNTFSLIAADNNLHNPHPLTLLQLTGLFRADLLWGIVLVPVLFCALTFWIAPRWRILIAVIVSCFIQVIIIVETLSMLTTGAFNSRSEIRFALWWALRTHDTALYYHPLATGILSAADLGFAVLLGMIALVASRKNFHLLNQFVLAAFAIGAIITAIAYVPRVPAMPWSESLLQLTASPVLFSTDVLSSASSHSLPDLMRTNREDKYLPAPGPSANAEKEVNRTTPSALPSSESLPGLPELLRTYREDAHVPAPAPTAYTGKAVNYNVVIIVLESMTAQAFDPAHDSLSDMPSARRLRDQSFLMGKHYTTYASTYNGTFAIYTSIYTHLYNELVPRLAVLPGLIRTLRNHGYATGFYGFIWNIPGHREYDLPLDLGFEKISRPSTLDDEDGEAVFTGPIDYVNKYDNDALLSMLSDIHKWTSQKRQFAVGFSPQIGHDPYRSLDGDASKTSLQRGHALAVYQDAWLGELLDELQRDKVLDHTLIVITGDHGMRSENPPGAPSGVVRILHGQLNDVVMRVPMLVYAPGVLDHSVLTETPTSHIDITPTVLDLLGFSSSLELEQGSPVYAPELDKRRVFLSMNFMGSSGFYENGEYYSRSAIGRGAIYKNSTLQFKSSNMLPFDSEEAENARKIIDRHDHTQVMILQHVYTGK